MDAIAKILRLLRDDDLEVRCAAAIVLGRLRPVEDRVILALRRALAAAEPATKSYMLDALAATRSPEVLEDVIACFDEGGALVEQAVQVVRGFGRAALPLLMKAHEGRDDWVSGAYIKAIAGIPSVEGVKMMFDRLHGAPWDQARATSIFLRENFSDYPKRAQAMIRRRAREYLCDEEPRSPHAAVTCLRLVQFLREPVAPRVLMRYTDPALSPSVQRHALLALEEQDMDEATIRRVRSRLFEDLVAGEGDAASILELVAKWDDVPPTRDELSFLASCRRFEPADFALRELGRTYGAGAADEIACHLDSPHPGIRRTAIAVLATLDEGRARLLEALRGPGERGLRMAVAECLAAYPAPAPGTLTRMRREYVEDCLEQGRYDRPLLEYLATVDRDGLNRSLLVRARGYMKDARHDDVIAMLQPVVRWRHATEESRFVLALANLRRAGGELATENRFFARCLDLLSPLARVRGYRLAERFRRAREVTPKERMAIVGELWRRGDAERRESRRILEAIDPEDLSEGDRRLYANLRGSGNGAG